MPNAHSIITDVPPLNTRERNSETWTMGCADRLSMTTKAAAAMAASAKEPRIVADVQPLSWPSISAYVSEKSMTAEETRPGMSRLREEDRPCDSLTQATAMANVITPTGTLMKKIQPHLTFWLMKPPMSGPNASASAP